MKALDNSHSSGLRSKNPTVCQHKTLSSASAEGTIICCFVYWLSLNDALDGLHGMQLCLSLQSRGQE